MLSKLQIDGFEHMAYVKTIQLGKTPYDHSHVFARAIESAACAERDKRIAELERKSDQDDETIAWQAQKISQHIDRIAELEQVLAAEREDVKRFRQHALNEKAARLELEQQLEAVRKDAERYRFIRDADKSDEFAPDLMLYVMESLDEYVDAAIDAYIDAAKEHT